MYVKLENGKNTKVRVLIKIRVAAAFYPQFIPISMLFIGRTEYLPVIILPHLTGGWHF